VNRSAKTAPKAPSGRAPSKSRARPEHRKAALPAHEREAIQNSRGLDRFFTKVSGAIAGQSGKPLAFILALGCVVVWAITGPMFQFSEVWQLVINTGTTIVTFLMVFLVQNTQNRDAAAMQAKLDELLRAIETARADFIGIEHLTDEEIERIRIRLEEDEGPGPHRMPSDEAVERLLERREGTSAEQ
jgi:low affinity Fe/Cu permease